jgi:polysaccharide pyruvyl transferase WcaK-like protein
MNTLSSYKKLKSFTHQIILIFLWLLVRIKLKISPQPILKNSRVVLLPADAHSLVGSKGDEAMLMAAAEKISKIHPAYRIVVACSNPLADKASHTLGMESIRIWGGVWMPFKFANHLAKINPAVGLIMGADVMDGYYSPVTSLRMIIAADLLSRTGAKTAFLGFSMNDRPAPLLKYAFRMLDKKIKVNLRDPLSWERYQHFTGLPANLVADSAFLLQSKPLTTEPATAATWIESQKFLGKTVLALNFHPMLYSTNSTEKNIECLTDSVLVTMRTLSQQYNLSWLLLPHDDRENAGDITTLSALYQRLNQDEKGSVYLINKPPTAAEIKELASGLDGAITGRMHLAIAALGKSIPVMVFAYQAKFVGLLLHFSLPEWLILDPVAAIESDFLTQQVEHFVRELSALKTQVENELPQVMLAAESNFEGMQ